MTDDRQQREAARRALSAGAGELGLSLDDSQLDLFDQYADLLEAGRAEANLTALSDRTEVVVKHFVDSLALVPLLPADARRLIDVGSGAGFPGLALKIVRPDLDVVLLEATGKKVAWLNRTAARLGLSGLMAIAERAETLGHVPDHRQAFDVATARAVAPLAVLSELCLPFVRRGGRFIALKTATAVEVELPQAERALQILGGVLRAVIPIRARGLPNRALVDIEQTGTVPAPYPRRPGMPNKRPL